MQNPKRIFDHFDWNEKIQSWNPDDGQSRCVIEANLEIPRDFACCFVLLFQSDEESWLERVSGSVLLAMSDESTRLVGPTSERFPFCDLVGINLERLTCQQAGVSVPAPVSMVVGSQEMEFYWGNSRSVSYEVVVSDNFLQFLWRLPPSEGRILLSRKELFPGIYSEIDIHVV